MVHHRLLASVVTSVLLYGAPAWHRVMATAKAREALDMALRVISANRTVSGEAVFVISGIPPATLLAEERDKDTTRADLIVLWRMRRTAAPTGAWMRRLIPDPEPWVTRKHGEVDYHLTQALTGHGVFRSYLHRMHRVDTHMCVYYS